MGKKQSAKVSKPVPMEAAGPASVQSPQQSSKSIQAQAMDAMMETLLSKKLQIQVKEKQKEQNQTISSSPTIFNSEKLDHEKYINDGDEEIEYIVQQREIFQPYACQVCKAVSCEDKSLLKRCNGCKMMFYCSKEHQKDHWFKHKDLCKLISRICKQEEIGHLYEKSEGMCLSEYRKICIARMNQAIQGLGRQMELWEREMFYHVPACQTCYLTDKDKLKFCEKCLHVNYCKAEHCRVDHVKWCDSLSLHRDLIFHQAKHGMIQPTLPNKIFTQPIRLADSMQKFLLEGFGPSVCMQWNRLTHSVMTDVATCPLTIIYALQQCHLNPHFTERNQLTIHMVGAELHFEADTIRKYELLLLHLLPNLTTLRIIFVGPELRNRPDEMINYDKCCNQCRKGGREVIFEFYPSCFYHDYVNTSGYIKPDIICAFNAGLYRSTGFAGNDTWPASIKVMLRDTNIPVLVTAYTSHELPQDVARMQECNPAKLLMILEPSENPFASRKPSLNFINEEETPVIFKNFYIAIVQGSE